MLPTPLTLTLAVSTAFTIILLCLPSRYRRNTANITGSKSGESCTTNDVSVQVVVLGDIGRSPRMQYHALSLANHGGHVQVIGHLESELHPDLIGNPRVSIVPLQSPPRSWQTNNNILFLFLAPLKVAFQIWTLWLTIGYRTKPAKWMLVQNPPSIPTLGLAWIVCSLRCTRLVIDWHNFGYTMLAMKLGDTHPLVRASKWYERRLCQSANAHFTVTDAMRRVLLEDFNLKANVFPLHDRPASQFQPLESDARKTFLSLLDDTKGFANSILTEKTRLIVSSTSWTPDEDFSILLEALSTYCEKATTTYPQLPEILVIITGKGPGKEKYLRQIEKLKCRGKLEVATIKTAWLSLQDYASLLASADLGVSLHTSSSGVDLPMKVVDMFGAGLPVLGWNKFAAWPELVVEGRNGIGFGDANEMAEKLVYLFSPEHSMLARLREGALAEGKRRWDDEWDLTAGKLFELIN